MTSVFLKITIGMAISKTTISVKKEPVQDRVSKKEEHKCNFVSYD